jgi:hypothetical protein
VHLARDGRTKTIAKGPSINDIERAVTLALRSPPPAHACSYRREQ